jgi:hypothetical protein
LVFVQELVAPPFSGDFPDGSPFEPDAEARMFFEEMQEQGFEYVLSEEDTGSGPEIHVNGPATEWFVAFYKRDRVEPLTNLAHGFLAEDRSDHDLSWSSLLSNPSLLNKIRARRFPTLLIVLLLRSNKLQASLTM